MYWSYFHLYIYIVCQITWFDIGRLLVPETELSHRPDPEKLQGKAELH